MGLRCLRANLGEMRDCCALLEFDPRGSATQTRAEAILRRRPKIVGLGVYIWNASAMADLASALKARAPEVVVVVGGPEVSHEWEDHPATASADYVVRNEGETVFAALCAELLAGRRPGERVWDGGRAELSRVSPPYTEYSDLDLRARFTYVETSRGCPYGCEFCLSSLDPAVREWPLEAALAQFDALIARGARRFKFVDRTFNLSPARAAAALRFFLERMRPGLIVHFEIFPSRLPEQIKALFRRFPPGALRLEVGVQTFDADVNAAIGRRQRAEDVETLLDFLRRETAARVHADLLAGLPGGGIELLARDFDRLIALAPAEIQIGLLKRLRGTAVARRAAERGMRFDAAPPYALLESSDWPAEDLARVTRLAAYWERLGNRRAFPTALPLLWADGGSPFRALLELSDFLWARFGATHGIALDDLAVGLRDRLIEIGFARRRATEAVAADYLQGGRRLRLPPGLRGFTAASSRTAGAYE